jgi:hypothetical protein
LTDFATQIGNLGTSLQGLVDRIKAEPAFSDYVRRHKLGLLDSRFELIDRMLDAGLLKD